MVLRRVQRRAAGCCAGCRAKPAPGRGPGSPTQGACRRDKLMFGLPRLDARLPEDTEVQALRYADAPGLPGSCCRGCRRIARSGSAGRRPIRTRGR
jgi:hypothetical protein